MLEGVKRSEYRGILAWVRSRLDHGDSVEAIRGLLNGTSTGAAPSADTSVLDGTVKKIKAALESGSHDADLDALVKAEKTGRKRKGVLSALAARRSKS